MLTLIIMIMIIAISFLAFYNSAFYEKCLFDLGKIKCGYDHYRFLSSGFIHVDIPHLIFNLVSFQSFALDIEENYAASYVAIIFIIGIISGNLFSFVWHRNNYSYRAAGASGGVCAIIYSYLVLMKPTDIYLMLIPIPIPDKVFAVLFLFFSTIAMSHSNDQIGHAAHIGGAVAGIIIGFVLRPDLIFAKFHMLSLILIPFVMVKAYEKYQARYY